MAIETRKLAIIQQLLQLDNSGLLQQVEELLADNAAAAEQLSKHPEQLSTTQLQQQLDHAAQNIQHDHICTTKAVWELFNPQK